MSATAYNRNLNGLRGLCAFLVFVRHVWAGPRLEGWWGDALPHAATWDFLFNSLQCAVEIFFMISGFLITASLLRAPSAGHFLLNRVLRIYPVFLATHLVLFALGPALHYKLLDGVDAAEWSRLFATNILLLPGVFDLPLVQTNAWSLSYEAAFYGFAVIAAVLGRQLPRQPQLIVVALATAGICFFYPRAVFFGGGAVVYLLGERAVALGRSRWLAPALLLPLLFLLLQASIEAAPAGMRLGYGLGFFLGIAVFAALVHGTGGVARFLARRPMQYLGNISYSFYLWHPFAYFAGKKIVRAFASGLPPLLQLALLFVIALPLALALSHASWRLIERRATGLLRRRLQLQAVPSVA
ncbi:acyltransferase [Aliidongia dinghuensis]|uniref:Acyltransferase n=1 Tax=Aliidongia dinghuensis TaxID=1867774 RepID=A0A8J2YV35_9PROT|nr:acyltransferase [Aliidongia dinghuensis]GGF26205.1 acyltransferase [Aliidongia dinghuensis]